MSIKPSHKGGMGLSFCHIPRGRGKESFDARHLICVYNMVIYDLHDYTLRLNFKRDSCIIVLQW